MAEKTETAVFAAGCFWGVEETFRGVDGVTDVEVGYTGGETPNPTYEQVCTKTTGHAEAVRVVYDPERVSFDRLVDVFWDAHDPTQVNRQGPDVGSQYRTGIFYMDEGQRVAAEAAKQAQEASGRFAQPIATEITPASAFYRAEEYHQQYIRKRKQRFGGLFGGFL